MLGSGLLLLVWLFLGGLATHLMGLITPLPAAQTNLALLVHIVHQILSFGFTTLLLAMMFKILPDHAISWRDVWLAALITALLFGGGRYLISAYITGTSLGSSYGAAGALLVLLAWVYYSAQILLFGAELAKACNDAQQHPDIRF